MSLAKSLPLATPGPTTPSPRDAEDALLRTVAYSAVFQAPLTLDELHRRLMDVALDQEQLRACLDAPSVRRCVALTDGIVYPRGEEGWLSLRRERQAHTASLLQRHRVVLWCLAHCPFVRLLALSGACAHANATDDDVDLFLVVKKNRAWAVCLTLMVASKFLGLRRTLCLNYIVDEAGMSLPETDLFTASEIVGMKPLAGAEAYRRFLRANSWVGVRFPNFWARQDEGDATSEAKAPRWLEGLLDLGPAQVLEAFSRRALGAYLRRKGRGCAGVVLRCHRLKLHLDDHRPRLTAAFEAALAAMRGESEVKGTPIR